MNLHDPLAGAVVGVPEDYDPAKCSTGRVGTKGAELPLYWGRNTERTCIENRSQNASKLQALIINVLED